MVDLFHSLVGRAGKTSQQRNSDKGGGGAGVTRQQCIMGNAKFPPTVECFSSLSQNRGAQRFQWKKTKRQNHLPYARVLRPRMTKRKLSRSKQIKAIDVTGNVRVITSLSARTKALHAGADGGVERFLEGGQVPG